MVTYILALLLCVTKLTIYILLCINARTLHNLRANHVSSSQSGRSKRVTCRCIKSLNAHFASLNAHFVEHKNAKATRRALKHLDHTFRCTKRYKALGQVNNGLDRG